MFRTIEILWSSVRILILIVIKVIIYVVIVVGVTSVGAELAHAGVAAEAIASPIIVIASDIVVLMMVQMHEYAVHIGIVGVKIIIAMLLLVGIEPRLRVPA